MFFPFKEKLPTKLINPTFENYLLNFKSNLTVNIHHFYLNYSLYQQVVSFHFKTQSWIILAYKKEMFILIFLTTVSQKQKFYLKETFFFCFFVLNVSIVPYSAYCEKKSFCSQNSFENCFEKLFPILNSFKSTTPILSFSFPH